MAKRIKKISKNIQVLIADTFSPENSMELTKLIELLPSKMQYRATRYKNKHSSINYCFGRLMLLEAISTLGFNKDKLDQLHFSDNDKPLIDGFYFSISHSENIVALAYSLDSDLALDIEKIQNIELKNFKSFFREDEWRDINHSNDPIQKFYWYWIRKESILKAEDGKMNQVNDVFITSENKGYFKNPDNAWYLTNFYHPNEFIGSVAHKNEGTKINYSPFRLKNKDL